MSEKNVNEQGMIEKVHEQISALVDGELGSDEQEFLIRRLAQDEALQEKWDRYNLISDVMQNHLSDTIDTSMAERVCKAVDKEDALQMSSQSSTRKKLLKSAAGLSIAASVAVFSIIGVQQYNIETVDDTVPNDLLASSATTSSRDTVEYVAKKTNSNVSKPNDSSVYARASGTRWNHAHPKIVTRLNSYLVNHNEYTSATNLQGMVQYANIAGYDAQ